MNNPSAKWRDLDGLIDLVLDNLHTPEDSRRLNEILRADFEACRRYVAYMKLHGRLTWGDGIKADSERGIADLEISDPPLVIPSPSTTHYPQSTNFVGGPVFSYMVATLVLCMMLLGAWAYKITNDASIATNAPAPSLIEKDASRSVARITGMKDCQWPADAIVPMVGSYVPLGRKYTLNAGLLEISYESGARVILEGPCEYNVDSLEGGYLTVGKLTARIERIEKSEVGRVLAASATSAKPQAANPQPPAPLFSVRTPTAVITDLGTEFGVEVAADGATESHVIEGSVDVRVLDSNKDGEQNHLRLEAGNAVRVEPNGKTITVVPFASERFVRMLAALPDRRAEEAYIKAVLADKPLGYWPLNEPARARRFADLSGNGFHGSAMGNVAAGAAGPLPGDSNAVELSGDGYIDVGRRDEFALENGFTFEAWIFLDDDCWTGESLTHIRVISATSSDGRHQKSGWSVGFKPFAVGRQPFCCFGPHGYQTGATALRDADVPLSRWVHVALVYGSDNVATLYLNGIRRASALDGRPVKIGPTWVSIGFGAILRDEYWRGRLAHVAVYPTTLSGQQIINHYKYFEKSAGGNVTDSSATTQENERR